MANKKPLTKNKQGIADADNLLLPSMTITDGGSNTIDLTDLPAASHDNDHSLIGATDTNGTPTDGKILSWNSSTSKFDYVNNEAV